MTGEIERIGINTGGGDAPGCTALSILGTTNRGNTFKVLERAADVAIREIDQSDRILEAFRKHLIDAHIPLVAASNSW